VAFDLCSYGHFPPKPCFVLRADANTPVFREGTLILLFSVDNSTFSEELALAKSAGAKPYLPMGSGTSFFVL
jgi:hypothetical protein